MKRGYQVEGNPKMSEHHYQRCRVRQGEQFRGTLRWHLRWVKSVSCLMMKRNSPLQQSFGCHSYWSSRFCGCHSWGDRGDWADVTMDCSAGVVGNWERSSIKLQINWNWSHSLEYALKLQTDITALSILLWRRSNIWKEVQDKAHYFPLKLIPMVSKSLTQDLASTYTLSSLQPLHCWNLEQSTFVCISFFLN